MSLHSGLRRAFLVAGAWTLVSACVGMPTALAAEIVDLLPVIKQGRVLVSFEVEDAFDDDIERAIESGLPVTFRYKIELKRVRRFWMNAKVSVRIVETTVSYDNLTERYSLTRSIDGEVDASEITMDTNAMRRFMTYFEFLSLFDTDTMKPDDEYYLRVNGVMRERNRFFFIPWDRKAGWTKAYFTFMP